MNPGSAYRPGREIARGGMGAVLDARDQKLGRSVAMKVMLRRNASEEEQQRFLQEARVLGQLAHPNIVPVHDVGTDEQGRLFYTMKLVVGVTLHDVIGKLKAGDKDTLAKYPLNALLTIFQKVCDAVAFAHSRGIIHRDLKPQNIMVGEFGEVLVMDWGLAKILPGSAACASLAAPAPGTGPTGTIVMQAITPEAATHASIGEQATVVSTPDTAADQSGSVSSPLVFASSETPVSHLTGSQLTLDGTVMGTPNYMSPEQAAGRIAELDKRSDVFSLGGVLYALLTLRPPVEGKDVNELLARVCRGDITPPALTVGKNLLPHLPDGRVPVALSAVTMKALRHERADRYPTVEKLARDIAAYQGGFATSAEEAGVLTLLRLFLRRHRALSAAAALIVLLTIVFMAKVISSEQKATASAAEAKVEARRATDAEQQAKVDAQRARAAEELAGQKGEAARQALTRAALALAEAAQREGNGPAMQAALNEVPDDRRDSTWRYLLEQSDTSIARLRLGSSEPVAVAPHPQQPGVFAVVNAHGEVALMEVRTGVRLLAFKPVFPPNTYGLPRIAISPDGERIAVGRNGPGSIAIHSARDGKKLLDYGSPPCDRLEFSADGKLLLQVFASQIHVWDAGSGQAMCSFPPEASGANVRAAFTPDSQHVLVADFNDKAGLPLVRARDGIVVRTVPRKGFIVRALVVRTDGTAIIAGESGGLARIVMQDGRLLWEARLGERRIDHLALAPDGERLATALGLPDGRQDIRIWQMNSGRPLQTLLGGSGALSQISVHPLSGELVMAGPNARAWNLTGTPATWTLPGSTDGAAFFGADDLVFASASGSSLALHQLQPGNPVVLWKHPSVNCRLPASSADGRVAAVAQIGGNAPTLLLRRSGAQVEQFATIQLSPGVSVVRLSPTGDRLAAIVAARGEAAIHDPATGQQPVKLEQTDMKRRWDLGWLDGQRLVGLVTARADRGLPGSEEWVVLWDATTGKVTQTVTNRTAMDVLAIAPDGRRFAEAGADKVVRIRNAATLAVQSEFRAHDGPITALAWHPTKPIVATASEDLSTRLWNLDTGERLEELRGPVMPPVGLAFSPGGQRLTCAVKGDKTHIWEPVSLNPKARQDSGNKTADGWENLLAQLTPAVVTSMGDGWRMGGGVIFSTGATGPGRKSLPLPGDFSAASYQVRVKLRRLVPRDFFHLALPVGDRQVGFVLDGSPAQGFYTGLSQVNGRQGKESPGAIQGLQVGDTESHELEVTVRLAGAQAAIAVTLDGQPLYEWAGPLSSLSQGSYWKTPPGVLALGTGAADWVVYEVKVKRLDGK